MKAPDKMYIGSCDPSLGRGFATASVEKMKSDDIKYIRKDALLEWLESKIYQWKSYYNKATTNTERAYCQKMIRMYLKRFIYYINK